MSVLPAKSIKENPNGTWKAEWYVNRRRRQKTFSSHRLASDWLSKKRLESERGEVYDIKNKIPISDIIDLYKKNVEKSAASIERDGFIRARWLQWLPAAGIRYVSDLSKREIADYERHRRKDKVGQRTINIDIKYLNAALNYAWKIDEIDYNPIAKYPYKREDSNFQRFLTFQEIDAILLQSRQDGLYDAVYTGLTLGLRCEEICFLERSDLKDGQIQLRKKDVWFIHQGKKKNRKWAPKWSRERWVSLNEEYANDHYIDKIMGSADGYCFPHRCYDDGRPYTRDFFAKAFRKIVDRARITVNGQQRPIDNAKEINVHTLRHTHISYMVARVGLDKNINLRNIMENVGIGDLKTLIRYTKVVKNLGKNLPDPTHFPWQK